MRGDVISVEGDTHAGETLIEQVMRGGKRTVPAPTLTQIRERAAAELARLPEPMKRLEAGAAYEVTIADALKALAAKADAKTHR